MTREETGGPAAEQVGSVSEEAARLFDVFSEILAADRVEDRATDPTAAPTATGSSAGPDPAAGAEGPPRASRWSGEGLAALAADALSALREAEARTATDGEDCRWCPVCRTIHAVRETTPEVRAHLLGAARSLLAAGTALVEQLDQSERPTGPAPTAPTARAPGVERIDLDDARPTSPEQEDGRCG